ncbi:hypothetical protein ACIP88_08930 [Streptomyces uncialis]|uniref:hypothetical protein n=1 Tax=Streptomyces uncialis TaxID=1048205 RepID=UPI003826DD97
MSVQDDLTAVQRCIDDLTRTVGQLTDRIGREALEVRRVRTDAAHLRESVELLREFTIAGGGPDPRGGVPQHRAASPRPADRPDIVRIPDTPYDSSLWTDSDDEGLGARARQAP